MGPVIIAVIADIAFVVVAVLVWRVFGDRIRAFVEDRPPMSFFRR
jgi:hypothetical protein